MIKINNICKSFGPKTVLSRVSLEIQTGKTFCIVGKSGCGKSVLIKNIVGLLEPDSGSVEIDGSFINSLNQKELSKLRRRFGFVFQGAALFDSFTVFENVVLSLYEHGERDNKYLESEAKRVLSAVGLLPSDFESNYFEEEWNIIKDLKPADLSGGMKKRVGVARALVGSPDYVFYDEPTTGLDPVTSEQIDNLIAELGKKFDVTSIVITHDLFSVYKIADEVAMISDGKVRFVGTPDELKSSNDYIIREFLERYE